MEASQLDAEMIRRLIMEQPEPGVTRGLALIVSAVFLASVLELVRRGKLREEHTPIWVIVGVGILVLSAWFDLVRMITRAVGAWTPSSTLFFFGVLFLLVLSLHYAVRLSALTLNVKLLAQELALLRSRLGGDAGDPSSGDPGVGRTDDVR